jgi:hypothetical protein
MARRLLLPIVDSERRPFCPHRQLHAQEHSRRSLARLATLVRPRKGPTSVGSSIDPFFFVAIGSKSAILLPVLPGPCLASPDLASSSASLVAQWVGSAETTGANCATLLYYPSRSLLLDVAIRHVIILPTLPLQVSPTASLLRGTW